MTELEEAAMFIVLEAPRWRPNTPTAAVRRELVTMLETALRKQGYDIDAGRRYMRRWQRQQKAKVAS